jgi:DNA-binding NtrC family response regulator
LNGEQQERVLVVDDEPDMAESCGFLLERQGYAVATANTGERALELMAERPFALVVSDVRMPRMSGLQLLTAIKRRDPDVEVVLITGYPEIQAAVAAIKQGAFDYLTKPYQEKELLERVAKAIAHRRMKDRNAGLRERLRSGPEGRRLVYRSSAFAQLIATLDRTTIPAELFESELFGHQKGAFSGASADKMGLVRIADGGTLFFDEIGELPLPFQPKLLRAIQERSIRPVGSSEQVAVDVRIGAATNRGLQRAVDEGTFRGDLFYRLNVVRVEVPPLRQRREDIDELARHFVLRLGASAGITGIADDALAVLRTYHWPGNVRQLRNAIERACTLASGPLVTAADLPAEVRGDEVAAAVADGEARGTFQERKARTIAAMEQTYLEELLQKHKGNVTHSADEAGMTRSALQKLLQKYNIKSSDFRDG